MKFEKQLEQLVSKLDVIPDDFWINAENGERVIWFLDREDGTAGDYEISQERLGLTITGKIIYGYSSGCSCWLGWESSDYCPTMSYKEFIVSQIKTGEELRTGLSFAEGWEDESLNNLNDFLLLVNENTTAQEVLTAKNAEIRRYLIKRIGYEKIKEDVGAELIHEDGTSQLLKFNTGEQYVKVKDSSTDREYLIYVPNNIKSCKQGIAWTFGLREDEYNPIIET